MKFTSGYVNEATDKNLHKNPSNVLKNMPKLTLSWHRIDLKRVQHEPWHLIKYCCSVVYFYVSETNISNATWSTVDIYVSCESLNQHSREIQHLPSGQLDSFENQAVMNPEAWKQGIAIRLSQSRVWKYWDSLDIMSEKGVLR